MKTIVTDRYKTVVFGKTISVVEKARGDVVVQFELASPRDEELGLALVEAVSCFYGLNDVFDAELAEQETTNGSACPVDGAEVAPKKKKTVKKTKEE